MKWNSLLAGSIMLLLSHSLVAQEAPEKIDNVITINVYQAKRLYDLDALFIDVRSSNEWQWGHVDSAQSLDLQAGFRQLAMSDALDKRTPIVIYGNSAYHMRGAVASYLAALWGYERVFFLRDGYYSWLARGYPVTLFFQSSIL